ncbi:hypothetical protein K3495_g12373 [Podosphaera aphanis]|nr:hypothetical protein K3495_g12373 [Podosphaera aphanis]
MWSPIIFIALSQFLNLVSAGGVQCEDRVFTEYEVGRAARHACKIRRAILSCRNNLGEASNKLNKMVRPWGDYFRQNCPTVTGTFPTSYSGNLFRAEGGPYISWHLTSVARVPRVMSLNKDLAMYRVVVRYKDGICEPVGAIIVRKGNPEAPCTDLEGRWTHTDSGGEWVGAKTFHRPSHRNYPASPGSVSLGPVHIDGSSPISTIPRKNSVPEFKTNFRSNDHSNPPPSYDSIFAS